MLEDNSCLRAKSLLSNILRVLLAHIQTLLGHVDALTQGMP